MDSVKVHCPSVPAVLVDTFSQPSGFAGGAGARAVGIEGTGRDDRGDAGSRSARGRRLPGSGRPARVRFDELQPYKRKSPHPSCHRLSVVLRASGPYFFDLQQRGVFDSNPIV